MRSCTAKIELLARAIDRVVRNPEVAVSMETDSVGAYMPSGVGEGSLHMEMTLHDSFSGYA
jgi:hypothetical protein